MATCVAGISEQVHWVRDDSTLAVKLMHHSHLCLDLAENRGENGAAIQLWDCNRGAAQMWFYDSLGRLRPWDYPSMCMDTTGAMDNEAEPHLWECLGLEWQSWQAGGVIC